MFLTNLIQKGEKKSTIAKQRVSKTVSQKIRGLSTK